MFTTIKMSDLASYADYFEEDPNSIIEPIISRTYEHNSGNDVLTPFRHGKEWAYEIMEQHQPKTALQLLSGGDFKFFAHYMGIHNGLPRYLPHLVQEVNGFVVEVRRMSWGNNPADPEYAERIARVNAFLTKRDGRPRKSEERHLSLPEPLRLAYYHRIDGLGIPIDVACGTFTRLLPYPIGRPWESIDGFLGSLRLKKKYLPAIEEMIPDVKPKSALGVYTNFMMFLSSWDAFPANSPRKGDFLFVKNHIQDGIVYYIRDADIPGMTILENPAEAIDRYCEHVLLRKEGRFDFRPWAVPFVEPRLPNAENP